MKDLKKKNILKFEQLRWCWQTSEFNILLLAWQTSVKMIGVSGSGRTEGNSTKSSFHYHRQRRYVGISCLYINQPPTVCRSIRRMSEELSTRRARPLTPPCSADRNHGWRHCREQSFTPPTTDHTQTPPSHLQIHKRDRAATDRLLSRRSRSVSLMYYFINRCASASLDKRRAKVPVAEQLQKATPPSLSLRLQSVSNTHLTMPTKRIV